MEHGKNICNIFVMDVYKKKVPGFASKKTKKTFDCCLVQSIFKKKFDCPLKLI